MKELAHQFISDLSHLETTSKLAGYFIEEANLISNGKKFLNKEEYIIYLQNWKKGFPDLQITITDSVISDDAATISWYATGTQTGIYLGILPTQEKVTFSGIFIFKMIKNKFYSINLCWDLATVLDKLNITSHKVYTENDFCNDFTGPAKNIYEVMLNSRTPPCGIDQVIVNAFRCSLNRVPMDYSFPRILDEDKLLKDISVREIFLDTKPNKIRALFYKVNAAGSENKPLLLYLHGGGWVMMSPEHYDLPCRKLALNADMNILSIDYRLLPEHAFPAPFEDCVNAYYWLIEQGIQTLSLKPNKILIGGDSAGGTMAAGVILKMHDEKIILPDAALLFSPVMDMEFEKYPSFRKMAKNNLFLSAGMGGFQRGLYLPYHEWQNPYYSPMVGDLRCFPSTFISAGGDDPLIDDNKIFASKLKKSGVHVELFVSERMPHDYQIFLGSSPSVQCVYDAIAKFINTLVNIDS